MDYGGTEWKIAFSSFILLLLCFFVLMSSFSIYQKDKAQKVLESFNKAIHFGEKKKNIEKNNATDMKENDIDTENEKMSNMNNFNSEIRDISSETELIHTKMINSSKFVTIKVETPIYFEPGSSKILPDAFPLLNKIGDTILNNQYCVHIKGYVNSELSKGKKYENQMKESIARVVNVLKYFSEKFKIAKNMFSIEASIEAYRGKKIKNIEMSTSDVVEIILYKYE